MLEVVLTSFFFIILAEHALDTILLLRQLVFSTYTIFGILKMHYHYGTVLYDEAELQEQPRADDIDDEERNDPPDWGKKWK